MQKTKDKKADSAKESAENQNDNTARVAYVSQKTQRLAGALYALTRPFSPEEPLREALRNQALELISSAHALSEGAPASDTVAKLPALLNRLRSQLAVAKDGGLISAMNFSVLNEEIGKFIAEIQEIESIPGPSLDGDYFNGEAPALSEANTGRNTSPLRSSSVSEGGKGNEQEAKSSSASESSTSRKSAKDKRRQRILDLFEDQSEITVNDVTEVISGYSTKTIQRDLKALVKAGKLEKHGKRRWTSYTRA